MARMREKAVAPSGWGGSVQPYGRDLVLDVAPYSGDTNSVLVSRTGQALVVDATKTVAINAGAWWAWDLVDIAGQEVDRPGLFDAILGLTTLPTANSDIEVAIYLTDDDPDPAAATRLIWSSLRWPGAQNDPDVNIVSAAGGPYDAATATQVQLQALLSSYIQAGVETTWCKHVTGPASDSTGEQVGTQLSANSNWTTTASAWYVGVVVSPRSGAGGATDTLAIQARYRAEQGMLF